MRTDRGLHKAASWRETTFQWANSILLLLFAFVCAYPFYFILINSVSSPSEIAKGVYLIPQKWTLASYEQLSTIPTIYRSVFISAARTVVGTAITLFCCSFVGYLATKRDMPLRKAMYRFIVFSMFFHSGLIPWYILMKELHLKNTFLLYVLPSAVSAFFIILIKTYIESLPPALEDSAEVDGAGLITIFYKIVFPLSMPIVACVAVFSAVGQWNSWADNLYLVNDSKLNTLQYLLYTNLQSNMASVMQGNTNASAAMGVTITPSSVRLAMTVVTVLPILVVYPVMQKYFVKGILLGAVKG